MIALLLYFFGAFFLFCLWLFSKLFIIWDRKFDDVSKRIPGPPRSPIFGNTFQFTRDTENLLPLFDEWVEKYGHRIIYRVGTYWIVGLSNPRDIEKLLTSSTEIVKSGDYDLLVPWLGLGLLISNGEKWSKRRKLLTPAFHFKILESYMDVFNQQSLKFVDIIQRKHGSGEILDICPLISKMTLDIICETAMGVKINAQEQIEESDYIKAITRIKFLQQYRAFRPWLEPKLIWELFSYGREENRLIGILRRFTYEIIQQRKEDYGKGLKVSGMTGEEDTCYGGRKRLAFLDLLLEALRSGDLNSDEDVREETDTFMFEGHDTVSSGIAFLIFLIGNHPDVQSKIDDELHEVFGNDRTRPITIQDLGKLKYLECCIKESLRLCPSVPIIAREMQNNFELDEDVILPPDTLVLISPYQLHRNADVYQDPLCFRPERFSSDNNVNRHPFSYVPFSAGPRNCIGQKFALMEEKVVLANILRNYSVKSTKKLDELTLLSDLILHSKNGIEVKFTKKLNK